MTPTILITAGDSFVESLYGNTWPFFLKNVFPFKKDAITGRGGASNKQIKMTLFNAVYEQLKHDKSEEIFVAITWSAPSRYCTFVEHGDINLYPQTGLKTFNFVDSNIGQWVPLCAPWKHNLNKLYYTIFENEYDSIIDTLYNILDTQNFLKLNGIKYIMTTSWNIIDIPYDTWTKENNIVGTEHIGTEETLKQPDFKWICDMIDWDKFIPIKGQWEWTNNRFKDRNDPNDHHPLIHEHKIFVEEVMAPFINKKYGFIINKSNII
jgi:hypothetical protein